MIMADINDSLREHDNVCIVTDLRWDKELCLKSVTLYGIMTVCYMDSFEDYW